MAAFIGTAAAESRSPAAAAFAYHEDGTPRLWSRKSHRRSSSKSGGSAIRSVDIIQELPSAPIKATSQTSRPSADKVDAVRQEAAALGARLSGLWMSCGIIFATYCVTMAPGIAGGDSGEIVAESCHLGTVHPPGYPLISLLNHLFINMVPLHSPAWRANLLSALCTTGAAGFIYLSVDLCGYVRRRLDHHSHEPPARVSHSPQSFTSITGSAAAAALFSWSPLIWQYAVTAEVFGLNNLLMAALIYLALLISSIPRSKARARRRLSLVGAWLCGLSLTNQHTSILFEIPMILYVVNDLRPSICSLLTQYLPAFLLGLSPYLYLPLSAKLRPRAGSWGDVTTLSGFFHHLCRGDYGTFKLFSGTAERETFGHKLSTYAQDLLNRQGLGVVPYLAMIGLLVSWRWSHNFKVDGSRLQQPAAASLRGAMPQPRGSIQAPCPEAMQTHANAHNDGNGSEGTSAFAYMLAGAYIFYLTIFHAFCNLPLIELYYGVVARFWMQPNIIVFIWTGIGLDFLLSEFRRQTLRGCKRNWSRSDFSTATYFNQYARSLLDPLPRKSILLVSYDMQWTSLRYLQICEKFRTDVTVLNLSLMTFKWWATKRHLYDNVNFPGAYYTRERSFAAVQGAFTTKSFLDANLQSSGGMYLAGKLIHEDAGFRRAYSNIPVGLTSQFIRHEDKWNIAHWYRENAVAWQAIQKILPISKVPCTDRFNKETWEYTITRDYYDHLAECAAHLLEEALRKKDSYGDRHVPLTVVKYLVEAAWWFEVTMRHDPDPIRAHVLKNAGLAYMHLVRVDTSSGQTNLPRLKSATSAFDVVANNVTHWYKLEHHIEWKTWATTRFLALWAAFLKHPDAKHEADYVNVKHIFETVTKQKIPNAY